MTEPTASLDDLMLTAGVLETPAWFSKIKLPQLAVPPPNGGPEGSSW